MARSHCPSRAATPSACTSWSSSSTERCSPARCAAGVTSPPSTRSRVRVWAVRRSPRPSTSHRSPMAPTTYGCARSTRPATPASGSCPCSSTTRRRWPRRACRWRAATVARARRGQRQLDQPAAAGCRADRGGALRALPRHESAVRQVRLRIGLADGREHLASRRPRDSGHRCVEAPHRAAGRGGQRRPRSCRDAHGDPALRSGRAVGQLRYGRSAGPDEDRRRRDRRHLGRRQGRDRGPPKGRRVLAGVVRLT